MATTVIFGGTGFVGIHFTRRLLREQEVGRIVLADIKHVESQFMFDDISEALAQKTVEYVNCDVRNSREFERLPNKDVGLILNFAAIHREPGHVHHEYYSTNVPGAMNVCKYAESVGCNKIVFTSSIAVYEPTEAPKDEDTIPAPIGAYGGSKLAAEIIHEAWQSRAPDLRKLVIVRPGVVYGPSEGGNVTRMIKAIKKRLFVFVGNKETRKASIYVKELLGIIDHFLRKNDRHCIISNAVVDTPPSMFDYVEAIKKVTGWNRLILSVPYFPVLFLSFFVAGFFRLIGKTRSIDPARIRKLRRINNITSKELRKTKYVYRFTLESAFRDWLLDKPEDW